ncbi:hypothetical protein CC2G_012517 [Coprinopsis cinerea AmutBmut pab1-1]|nr:hypothetical protein CC2G_012517 [Coprinopsis cinerea AmutBmut pab1-1]
MCIGVWTLDHPDYALILCENRDEFIDRPTEDAHWHSFGDVQKQDEPGNVLSGRDIKAGGSWFGLNKEGRVALLTNITEPLGRYSSSRGALVSSFLLSKSNHPLEDELGKIVSPNAAFAGFNLLLLSPTLRSDDTISYDALFVTNHGGGGVLTSRRLTPEEQRCGCMSNGIDGKDASQWPKVIHATREFSAVLQSLSQEATETEIADHLFNVLAWRCSEPITLRTGLRNTVQVEPIPIVLEGSQSAVPTAYGTRLSTVLLIRRNGDAHFIERDIWKRDNDGNIARTDPPTQREFKFKLDLEAIRRAQSSSLRG